MARPRRPGNLRPGAALKTPNSLWRLHRTRRRIFDGVGRPAVRTFAARTHFDHRPRPACSCTSKRCEQVDQLLQQAGRRGTRQSPIRTSTIADLLPLSSNRHARTRSAVSTVIALIGCRLNGEGEQVVHQPPIWRVFDRTSARYRGPRPGCCRVILHYDPREPVDPRRGRSRGKWNRKSFHSCSPLPGRPCGRGDSFPTASVRSRRSGFREEHLVVRPPGGEDNSTGNRPVAPPPVSSTTFRTRLRRWSVSRQPSCGRWNRSGRGR